MNVELLYTSAPQGLKQGSRGFCTVVSTAGTPINLAQRLEALSAYRHVYPPNDPRAPLNPVCHSVLRLVVGGKPTVILSRIADYGFDYSQRSNKIAHHLAVEAPYPNCGPADVLMRPGAMREQWSGKCEMVPSGPKVSDRAVPSKICQAWQFATGDAGWGGILADAWMESSGKPVWIIFPESHSRQLLPLIAESVALLPEKSRWNATFSTYFTTLPPDVECRVRCVLAGTDEARMAIARGMVIDLTKKLPMASLTKGTEAARKGHAWGATPDQSPTKPTPSVKSSPAPTPHPINQSKPVPTPAASDPFEGLDIATPVPSPLADAVVTPIYRPRPATLNTVTASEKTEIWKLPLFWVALSLVLLCGLGTGIIIVANSDKNNHNVAHTQPAPKKEASTPTPPPEVNLKETPPADQRNTVIVEDKTPNEKHTAEAKKPPQPVVKVDVKKIEYRGKADSNPLKIAQVEIPKDFAVSTNPSLPGIQKKEREIVWDGSQVAPATYTVTITSLDQETHGNETSFILVVEDHRPKVNVEFEFANPLITGAFPTGMITAKRSEPEDGSPSEVQSPMPEKWLWEIRKRHNGKWADWERLPDDGSKFKICLPHYGAQVRVRPEDSHSDSWANFETLSPASVIVPLEYNGLDSANDNTEDKTGQSKNGLVNIRLTIPETQDKTFNLLITDGNQPVEKDGKIDRKIEKTLPNDVVQRIRALVVAVESHENKIDNSLRQLKKLIDTVEDEQKSNAEKDSELSVDEAWKKPFNFLRYKTLSLEELAKKRDWAAFDVQAKAFQQNVLKIDVLETLKGQALANAIQVLIDSKSDDWTHFFPRSGTLREKQFLLIAKCSPKKSGRNIDDLLKDTLHNIDDIRESTRKLKNFNESTQAPFQILLKKGDYRTTFDVQTHVSLKLPANYETLTGP